MLNIRARGDMLDQEEEFAINTLQASFVYMLKS